MTSTVTQILPPESTDCSFSWGTFPEPLAIHCEFDWEAILLVVMGTSLFCFLIGYVLIVYANTRFRNSEAKRIRDAMKERAKKGQGKCTFGTTFTRPTIQEWWRCRTCYGISDMGCCTVCANTCHKGHDLERSNCAHHQETRYCSCGASGRCQQNADVDAILKEEIRTFYQESDTDDKIYNITELRFHWHSGVDGAFFSARFTNAKKEEDLRVFEFDYIRNKVVAMGGPGSGQEEDTPEEQAAAEWDRIYTLIDLDGDGVLSATEIQRYFQKNTELQDKLSVSDQKSFESLLKRLDADGDGFVDRAEFAILVQEMGLVSSTPSQLEVAINCARDLTAADTLGTSDPFVQITATGLLHQMEPLRTSIKFKNLSPIWNERFKLDLVPGAPSTISFTVFDYDKVGDPDFLGYTELRLSPEDLSELLKVSRQETLRLSARPGNQGDQMFVRHNKGNLGFLEISVRASIANDTEMASKARKKKSGCDRTLCSECRRVLFFIPKETETRQWINWASASKRVRKLPMCVCGVLLLPDGWRDQLRVCFERHRGKQNKIDIETDIQYPLSEHIANRQIAGYFVRLFASSINVWAIVAAFNVRPVRNPVLNLNLSVLWLLYAEVVILMVTALHLLFYLFGPNNIGLNGFCAKMPDEVLGSHLFRTIPIGWFPQRWFHHYRKLARRASTFEVRHILARLGLIVCGVGCAFFFVPLPFYVITAKIAFLRHVLSTGGGCTEDWAVDLNLADVIICLNVANNIRNVIDVVYNVPPSELQIPFVLWATVMRRTKGQPGDAMNTFFHKLAFSPKERNLQFLYELFVLNDDGLFIKNKDETQDKQKNNSSDDNITSHHHSPESGIEGLEIPLLERSNKSPMLPLNMAVQNGEGETWLGEAAERLQEEITRLELESMNARQDARKAVEEKKQMEELTRSMMTPVQQAVRHVLVAFDNELSHTSKQQLLHAVSGIDARVNDLQDLVLLLAENPMLNEKVRTIFAEALGGNLEKFISQKKQNEFQLPAPPVVFPPNRAKSAIQHRDPVVQQPPVGSTADFKKLKSLQVADNVGYKPSIANIWSGGLPTRSEKSKKFSKLTAATETSAHIALDV